MCISDLPDVDNVLAALKNLRIDLITEEFKLHDMLCSEFASHNIPYIKEYKLAAHNRIDFLVEGGIGVEVKKGKPNRRQTVKQLERYTAFEEIKVIILVVERSLTIPATINGKRCISFGLNRNWGIAL